MHAAALRSVLIVSHHPIVAKAYSPARIPRAALVTKASADSPFAGAAFSDIAPNIQYVQLASAIVQRAQRMSAVLPDQGRKAPSRRTRRHACGILQSENSCALLKGRPLGLRSNHRRQIKTVV